MRKTELRRGERGIMLISTLFLVVALMGMLATYFYITKIELATTRATSNSAKGFAAAEAGLNLRAEEIRQEFLGYNRPSGTSPDEDDACEGDNQGDGDFICQSYDIGNHAAQTYVLESPDNPIITTIPPGELYQDLNAQEYRYTVNSVAVNSLDRVEAILELRFKSRLVPLFQFVAFYNKDLEILPGPNMTLSGPVHSNNDLYLDSHATLKIAGQVTMTGDLYRGRKNDSSCDNKQIQIKDPANYLALCPSCNSRTQFFPQDVTAWNGMIEIGVDELVVPEPEVLTGAPGNAYWDKADLRLVMHLNGSNNPDTSASQTGVEIRNTDDSVNTQATANLDACAGTISNRPIGTRNTFYNNREGKTVRMLEVDMLSLFNCIYTNQTILGGRELDDDTEGGLVFHFSFDGPDVDEDANNYGVRLRRGTKLWSDIGGAPTIKGLTVVTDQALYVRGHYNKNAKKPAAFLCDSFNVLSNAWALNDSKSTQSVSNRIATNTTINAAVLAGTDTTGGIEGAGGQSLGSYNGGLENYPRFHEKWSGKTFTYRGSFVSLNTPLHVTGGWVYGNPQYQAPTRDWDYDTDFNDAANLPPMTPRFVTLRQELFVRDFEQ